MLCRRCGKRPAPTTDGLCVKCKRSEVMKRKLVTFGRRQKAMNTMLSGGTV